MMKTIFALTAMMFGLSAYGASAQSVVEIPSRNPQRHERVAEERPAAPRDDDRDDRAGRRREWRADDTFQRPPIGHGARFQVEDGQARINVQCPDGEPMKECADVLLQIIDRMQNKTAGDDGRHDGEERERPGDTEGG